MLLCERIRELRLPQTVLYGEVNSGAFLILSLILVTCRLNRPVVRVTLLLVLLEILTNHAWLLRTSIVDMDRYSNLLYDRSL